MAGKYNGLQAKVKEECSYAEFIPCYGHSLNLVGTACADCTKQSLLFFNLLGNIHTFLSASPSRWDLFLKEVKKCKPPDVHALTVKRLSGTRWSESADATRAVYSEYEAVDNSLEELSENQDQKPETRLRAEGLQTTLNKLETGIMLVFWNKILQQFQKTSASLQAADLCLNSAQSLLASLFPFVESFKDDFDRIKKEAIKLTGCDTFEEETKRIRKRNRRYNDSDEASSSLSPAKKFKQQTYDVIIQNLLTELKKRADAYQKLNNLFGFLRNLASAPRDSIVNGAKKLVEVYPEDLEANLEDELIQFSALLQTDVASSIDLAKNRENEYFLLLKKHKLESTFPNVEIALRIYLTMMVTNCSGERSFSKLKRIKNEQQASISQDRLNNLTLLSIEHELLREIKVEDAIAIFASLKARKCPL